MQGHDARVDAVSLADAQAAIQQIVDPKNLIVVVVGDWSAEVESPQTADGRDRPITVTVGDHVRGLNLGDVIFLDEAGVVVAEPAN